MYNILPCILSLRHQVALRNSAHLSKEHEESEEMALKCGNEAEISKMIGV